MGKHFLADSAADSNWSGNPAFAGGARRIAITGILTAMTVVATLFTKIPTPLIHGYFNLGDTVVLIAGVLFGRFTGAFAGAIGSFAADLIAGAYIFAPITLIVKGLEGFIAGAANLAGRRIGRDHNPAAKKRGNHIIIISLLAGAIVMVGGYFIAEAAILSLFDSAFGLGAAFIELPFNLVQGGVSVVLARVAVEGLKRVKIFFRD
jgi:uncharacterized membrane protein